MAGPPNFEIPQQLRELTEKNLEQFRTGYGQFIEAMTQVMGMWANAAPASPITSGFKVVQDRATTFAKQNAETYFNRYTRLSTPNLEALALGVKIARANNDKVAEDSLLQQLRRRFPDSQQLQELERR